MYQVTLKGWNAKLYVDDVIVVTVLKGFLFKKEEVANKVSLNDVKEVSLTDTMLTIFYQEDGGETTLTVKFDLAEEAGKVEDIIKEQIRRRERVKKIDEIAATTSELGLTSDAIFGLALSLDKKCDWQRAGEEYQRLLNGVEALSNRGINIDRKILEEIEKEIEKMEPEGIKELIIGFVRDLFGGVSEVEEAGLWAEISNLDFKQFMELLLLTGTLGLILRRGLEERTGELKEAVQVKLSELEPVIDKQHIDEISERVKNDRYEALTEIPDLLANGIRAESEKLVEKI